METQTIASRNAVELLLSRQFDASICGAKEAVVETEEEKKDFVKGFDC